MVLIVPPDASGPFGSGVSMATKVSMVLFVRPRREVREHLRVFVVGARLKQVCQVERVGGDEARLVDDGLAADGVEDVGGEDHVQHLLDEDGADDLHGLDVRAVLDGVERGEVGRDGRVLDEQGAAQELVQLREVLHPRLDRHLALDVVDHRAHPRRSGRGRRVSLERVGIERVSLECVGGGRVGIERGGLERHGLERDGRCGGLEGGIVAGRRLFGLGEFAGLREVARQHALDPVLRLRRDHTFTSRRLAARSWRMFSAAQ
jgi:hypothetical protein